MGSAVHTDVDTEWWVDMLTVMGITLFPLMGLVLAEVIVWNPKDQAPGRLDQALEDKFTAPLVDAGEKVGEAFGVDGLPTAAFLDDMWIFDGNLAVAVAAFIGATPVDIRSVSHDTAYVGAPETGPRRNRRRPVRSVADITFTTGHTLTPWQAAGLVRDGLLELPGYHAVHQPKARGEWYLRSNPNDRTDDNLVR